MADDAKFKEKAPRVMGWLMADFGLTDVQAAGVLGNIGVECAGFTQFQELRPISGEGGYGWVQWTGPRRRAFMAFLDEKGLHRDSDDGNYGFLAHELRTSEKKTIPALQETTTLEDATRVFEEKFERPGIPHSEVRVKWAKKAIDAFRASLPG